MASFTLTIPDAIVAEVTAALCTAGGYPVVSNDNAKQATIDWITATVHNVQVAQAMTAPPTVAPITGLS